MKQTSTKKPVDKPDLLGVLGAGAALTITGGGHAKVDLGNSEPVATPAPAATSPAPTPAPVATETPVATPEPVISQAPVVKEEVAAGKKSTRGRPKNPPKDEALTVLTVRIPESLNDLFISATHAHWRRTKNKAGIQSILAPAIASAIRKFANEEGVSE